MDARLQQKPGIEEWLSWSRVVTDRLTGCVHVYKNNIDVFMAAVERQTKTDLIIKLLQRLYSLLDQGEKVEAPSPKAVERDEQIVGQLRDLFDETLKALPWLSADMQKLLKSPWMNKFPSKIAEILFSGNGDEFQGIGSGYPEQGRLPAALSELLEREDEGETRLMRQDLPQRHDVEGHDRWVQQNSSFARTAGRVE